MADQSPQAPSGPDMGPDPWSLHVRPSRRAALLAIGRTVSIVVAFVVGYYLLPLDARGAGDAALFALGLLCVLLVFLWEVRTIVRSSHPRLKAVEALAATLALFLVLFAGGYFLLEHSSPGSFNEPLTRTDALYFTVTTLSTVGYGDIAADSEPARVMVMLQMVCGLLFVGGAARVLTGAVQAGLRQQHRGPPSGAGPDTSTPDQEVGP
ncbi:metal transporter [Streptomyces fructofermentans]|uniref:Metal transporter n=1 Tax=Streptomyces fructofermentans TaxID=152141 RepID=A0A918NCF6_9ACTN|nr:metal transporter [Streptomyces fructofermentans]